MSRRVLATAFIAICSLLSACTDPPNREINQAQGAIDAARAAGADRYARAEYDAAVLALKGAQQAVIDRDYRLALNNALDSRERAQNAAREAADQKAILRSQVERTLGELTVTLEQAHERLAAAEAAGVAARTLAGPRAVIATAETAVQKAGAAVAQEDYPGARQVLADVAPRLSAAISELDAATSGRGDPPRR